MIKLLWRAATLLDIRTRRRYLLAVPAALLLSVLELSGFLALAAVVQVLAAPDLLTIAPETSLVGVVKGIAGTSSAAGFMQVVGGSAVLILILRGAAASLLAWWQAGLLVRAEAQISDRLFSAYLGADYGFHLQHHSADLIQSVAQSARSLIIRVLQPGVTLAAEAALVVGLAAGLMVTEPLAALASLVAHTSAMATYLLLVRKTSLRIGLEDQRLNARDHRILQEGFDAVKVLTVLERRPRVMAKYAAARLEHAQALRGLMIVGDLSRYYLESIVLVVMAAAAAVATLNGQDSVLASVGVLLAGMMRLLPSAQRLMTAINLVQVGRSSVDAVERDLEAARLAGRSGSEDSIEAGLAKSLTFTREIQLRELSYHFPNSERPTLSSINLSVNFGQSVGIIGSSGAGKTTLVDVLIGLLMPTSGGVYVDGERLTRRHLHAWRSQIGYVPQDTVIVDDSVRRNVALGLDDSDIDDAAVAHALEQAQLLETVAQMPGGLDAKLGERGSRLSGGQRQRIGIARALYGRPRILVLDEATASLDTETERQIMDTIERLYGEITVFIVAHRLSTVQRCAMRVVLAEGGIREVQVGNGGGTLLPISSI
jgi:ATP-binding cassette subfamily C protein